MAEFKELLQRPCQRFVCILHHAVLPFRHLFEALDGETAGPKAFKGPIGKTILENVWKQKLVEFTPLQNPELLSLINTIPKVDFKGLSKDHQHLIMMVKGALTGQLHAKWSEMRIGKVVHSRFSTTQARCLRLFMSTSEPSHELVKISNFTVNVYCPLFLAAKQRWKSEDAPKILLEEMKSARIHCTPEELAIVQAVMKQIGFYGHGENILYSLLSSNDKEDRKFAIDTIKNIRNMKAKSQELERRLDHSKFQKTSTTMQRISLR